MAASSSPSELMMSGSLAIHDRSSSSVAASPRLAIMSATSDWLYSLDEVRRQVRPWNCGSPSDS